VLDRLTLSARIPSRPAGAGAPASPRSKDYLPPLTTGLSARPDPSSQLWPLADRVARAIRGTGFRRRCQLEEPRDELAELSGTVQRLMDVTETVLGALTGGRGRAATPLTASPAGPSGVLGPRCLRRPVPA
jgi:hypothetical protein